MFTFILSQNCIILIFYFYTMVSQIYNGYFSDIELHLGKGLRFQSFLFTFIYISTLLQLIFLQKVLKSFDAVV